MKKHPEYLAGEKAKIHDSYMMKTWEEEEIRPLPQVVFNCGERFGFVTASVFGICPTVTDPYPALFRIDEEKRAIREKVERERRERYQQRNHSQYEGPYGPSNRANNGNSQSQGNTGGFVDVDDMKDNKVELSFDNIAIPLPPPKKKKKKKKKIL